MWFYIIIIIIIFFFAMSRPGTYLMKSVHNVSYGNLYDKSE